MIVAGGVYQERCLAPNYSSLLGSAGRAAAALAQISSDVCLHGFYPASAAQDALLAFAPYGVKTVLHESSAVVGFEYLHPLSSPRIYPTPLPTAETADVAGDVVLRFGCLEGSFRIKGRRVIYDPQSGSAPERFRANGSIAESLAVVLNLNELALMVGNGDLASAVRRLRDGEQASVVVVKMGADGALVFDEASQPAKIPAYRSSAVNKIGSGDIFSAVFAYQWGELGVPAAQAADIASRYTCKYVEDRCLPLEAEIPERVAIESAGKPARIYLGGPFFTTPQIWLVEEARAGLLALGTTVFSPMHEVGFGSPESVAAKDLAGLDSCTAMLALLTEADPGTLFEVGHARSKGIPVVAFMQSMRDQDPTMLVGTGCEVVSDFASALYRVTWAGHH